MININYSKRHGYMEFSGHACTAPRGHDVVCAAVSALHETLAMHPLVTMEKSADGDTTLYVDTILWPTMYPIFDAFAAGFAALAGLYPKSIRFNEM